MPHHESFYKISKTSWGIRITYRGKINEGIADDSSVSFDEIGDNIFLHFQLKQWEKVYFDQCKRYIENGIRWASKVISIEKPLYITISEVEFNYCDFQNEGFFFGIAYWLTS